MVSLPAGGSRDLGLWEADHHKVEQRHPGIQRASEIKDRKTAGTWHLEELHAEALSITLYLASQIWPANSWRDEQETSKPELKRSLVHVVLYFHRFDSAAPCWTWPKPPPLFSDWLIHPKHLGAFWNAFHCAVFIGKFYFSTFCLSQHVCSSF